jgi:hypothetical protein
MRRQGEGGRHSPSNGGRRQAERPVRSSTEQCQPLARFSSLGDAVPPVRKGYAAKGFPPQPRMLSARKSDPLCSAHPSFLTG